MASLGMKCTSGSCLYEPDGPAPPAPVPHEHKTNLVRAAAAAALGFMVQGLDPKILAAPWCSLCACVTSAMPRQQG